MNAADEKARKAASETTGRYRGRIAPTPTGLLHVGHAATFLTAWRRARDAGGTLILRNEDLDTQRCKPAFTDAFLEDLAWLGLDWDEGPDHGGPHAPYTQSDRLAAGIYHDAWRRLRDAGCIYPCRRSRKEIARAARAPHAEDETAEPVFPPEWRPRNPDTGREREEPGDWNWRFRVPDGETLAFEDGATGRHAWTAGEAFGDFLVWRRDGVPAYELAVVVDDHAMGITEVVRGRDLLKSTARQLLVYRALGATPPAFFHTPLLADASGRRLAKRDQARSLQQLRRTGITPATVRARIREAPRVVD
ncbi:MAG: tRNA glutamyl-Q(34) synthetase GluQRS [Opitutales bacterium]